VDKMHFQPQMDTDGHRYKQISKIRFLSAFICVHLWLLSCLVPVAGYAQETITVAVASSLYPAMQQQAKAFEQDHDVSIRLVSGSTGRLYNQIMQGAPFDVFIAADKERPELLVKQGKSRASYAVGQGYLGLMIGKNIVTDLKQLSLPTIRHIVIANPDVAPFGQASKRVLLQQGLWKTLQPKMVYAQNAMQARMMVEKGLVDAGFVPVVLSKNVIAVIHYYGVLLNDKNQSRALLGMFERGEITSGSAAQGECCLQQGEHPGVLAAPLFYIVGTAEAVLPK